MPQQPTAQQPGAAAATGSVKLAAAVQPLSVLHVRGKSGLKHTKQLLDCWLQHPQWPQLTVIGPMPNEQISGADAKRYMAAPNIRVPKPGKQQGECVDGGLGVGDGFWGVAGLVEVAAGASSGTDAKQYMAAPNIRVPNPGKQQGEWVDGARILEFCWGGGLQGQAHRGSLEQQHLLSRCHSCPHRVLHHQLLLVGGSVRGLHNERAPLSLQLLAVPMSCLMIERVSPAASLRRKPVTAACCVVVHRTQLAGV